MINKQNSRRDFLKATAAAAVSVPHVIPRSVLAAPGKLGVNGRIRTAVIGTGNRVRRIIAECPADLQLVAMADCNLPKVPSLAEFASKHRPDMCPDANKVARYQDYRRMLDKEKLDAVFVTTTTHARALICIHAVQAGLDVYAEKPLTLTIEEGRVLTNAVRKYQRVFQVGTQMRSVAILRWGCKLIRDGGLGKIKKVVAPNYNSPEHWTPKPAQPVPKGLDWDMWCNQAELRPYHPALCRGHKWERWWAYDGGGLTWGMTGWGTHGLDQIQSALGMDDTGPVEVWPVKPGDSRSPVTMRYANGIVVELKYPLKQGLAIGGYFFGEKGKVVGQRHFDISRGCKPWVENTLCVIVRSGDA